MTRTSQITWHTAPVNQGQIVSDDPEDGEWELLPIDGDTYGIFAVDADEDADPIRTAQGDEIDELEREVAEHNAGLAG